MERTRGSREGKRKKKGTIRMLPILMAVIFMFFSLGNGFQVQAAEKESASVQEEPGKVTGSDTIAEEDEEAPWTVSGGDAAADVVQMGELPEDSSENNRELDYVLGRPMTEEEEQVQRQIIQYYLRFAGEDAPPEIPLGDNTLPANMAVDRGILPVKYDSRNINGRNIVPAVRNQGRYGTCWSFSNIACLEINLIKNGLADLDVDLSELHLAFFASYSAPDPLGNDGGAKSYYDSSKADGVSYLMKGGNQLMAANALMNWKGAVDESLVTIDMALAGLDTEGADLAYGQDSYYLTNWYQIPAEDQAAVKDAIMKYGSVSLSYYMDNAYYNASTASEYCPDIRGTNHEVTVVGWDDSYNKYNFATTPSKDGAWLVRNSWGSKWGKEGYFWLSYEDQSIKQTLYVLEGQRSDIYENNYQYDHTTFSTYKTAVKAANVFTAKGNGNKMEELKAVGIAFYNAGISYSLQIYTHLTDPADPESGTPVLSKPQTGLTGYAGYYLIPLDEDILLEPEDTFAIVFELDRESEEKPRVGCEYETDNYRHSEAAAGAGESFYVYSAGYGWYDLGAGGNRNLKIKAYTDNSSTEAIMCQGIVINGDSHVVDIGKTVKCEVSFNPVNTTNKELQWSTSDPSVAAVSAAGIITGLKTGKAKITATTRKGGYSVDWDITVVQPVTSVSVGCNTEDGCYYVGDTYTVNATVEPANATDKILIWMSSDSRVAEVDSKGNVTFKAEGSVKITATAKSGVSGSITIRTKDDKVRSFAKRMYTKALGREEDAEGLKDWTGRLKNQEIDGAGIAYGFICSKEFIARKLDDSTYVDTLYLTFFDREADRGGKENWMQYLASGYSREFVLSGFVNSQEFSNLCDRYLIARGTMYEDGSYIYRPGVREFVLRLYTKALSRQGETTGVEDWVNRINTGVATAEEVAKLFFSSEEFVNRNLSDEDYVEVLYETFMDRASDASGKADWVGRLRNGMAREQVLEGFSQSEEFGNIMEKYGL